MARKRLVHSSATEGGKPKRVTGLDLFRQKFIKDNKEKYGSDFVRLGHRAMLDAWMALSSDEKAEYKTSAKRKREADMDNAGIPRRQKDARRGLSSAFFTRCSPSKFQRLVARLTSDQRADIEQMGFGGLLHVDCKFMGLDIIKQLAMDFDCFRGRAVFWGSNVQVTARDVGDVLGIPAHGKPVPNLKKSMLTGDVLLLSNISIPSLEENVMKGRVNTLFRRSFILFALTVLLCPTSKNGPTPRHLASIVDVSNPAEYNWAQYVLNWLCEEIKAFKGDGHPKKSMGGCVYFLMLFYFHKCPIPAIPVGNKPPLIKQWRNDLIQCRIAAERKNRGVPLFKDDSGEQKGRQSGRACTFRHKLSLRLCKQLAEHSTATEALNKTLEDIDNQLMQSDVPSTPSSSSASENLDLAVVPQPLQTHEGGEDEMGEGYDEPWEIYAEAVVEERGQDENMQEKEQAKDEGDGIEDAGQNAGIGKGREGTHQEGEKEVIDGEGGARSRKSGKCQKWTDNDKEQALKRLLHFCWSKPEKPNEEKPLVSIYRSTLTRTDLHRFFPRQWISNLVVIFAVELWNNETPQRDGVVQRHYICPTFMTKMVKFFEANMEEGFLEIVFGYFKAGYNIFDSQWVVIPTLYAMHWTCYFLDPAGGVLYVLDSMYTANETPKKELDRFTALQLGLLMKEFSRGREDPLRIVYAEVPQQKSRHDCGVYMLKFMENWNNEPLEGYTEAFISNARREYVLNWITHPKNEHREAVLKAASDMYPLCFVASSQEGYKLLGALHAAQTLDNPGHLLTSSLPNYQEEETQYETALSLLRLSKRKTDEGDGDFGTGRT